MPCGLCLSRINTTKRQKSIIEHNTLINNEGLRKYSEKLDELEYLCFNCLIRKDKRYDTHATSVCSTISNEINSKIRRYTYYIKINKLIPEGAACFSCYLPPKLCSNRKLERGLDADDACPNRFNLLIALYYIIELFRKRLITSSKLSNYTNWPNIFEHEYLIRQFFDRKITLYNTDSIPIHEVIEDFDYLALTKALIKDNERSKARERRLIIREIDSEIDEFRREQRD